MINNDSIEYLPTVGEAKREELKKFLEHASRPCKYCNFTLHNRIDTAKLNGFSNEGIILGIKENVQAPTLLNFKDFTNLNRNEKLIGKLGHGMSFRVMAEMLRNQTSL